MRTERDRERRANGTRAPTPFPPNHHQRFKDDAVLEDCVEVFTWPLGTGKPCAMETDPCSALPVPPTSPPPPLSTNRTMPHWHDWYEGNCAFCSNPDHMQRIKYSSSQKPLLVNELLIQDSSSHLCSPPASPLCGGAGEIFIQL